MDSLPLPERPGHLFTLAAPTEQALRALAGRFADHGRRHPDSSLPDFCYTANTNTPNDQWRLAIVCGPADSRGNLPTLCELLASCARGEDSSVVLTGSARAGEESKSAFLFAGQGAQYVGMGRQLYHTQPTFRATLDRCDKILEPRLEIPLLSILYPAEDSANDIDQTAYTQPALFALEYALAAMWRSWGVAPDFVLGHSVGELAAAAFAGAFSLEDGLTLIAERGRLIQSLPPGGSMMVVFADFQTVAGLIAPWPETLCIAAANGPAIQVVSGAMTALTELARACESAAIQTTTLAVSHAFHSPLMDPILDTFANVAAQISYQRLQIPLASNRDGRIRPVGTILDAAYWRNHIRRTVQFDAGIHALAEQNCTTFVEIGPATTLLSMARPCITNNNAAWLPSLKKSGDAWRVVLRTLAALYTRGLSVDWEAFDRPYGRRRMGWHDQE
jgi:acyl transferase domain-containing protein